MKIAFYVAHYPSEDLSQYPIGVGYLAASLISECGLSFENIIFAKSKEEIISFKPDVLAISSVSQVFDDARQIASVCKEAVSCYTILGGYHISALPHLLPKCFDVGVIGEGENTFVELIKYIKEDGLTDKQALKDIEGICYHSDNSVLSTPPRPLLEDIDNLPYPIRSSNIIDDVYLFTSRGCPYRCTFCASCMFWGKIRYHSAEYVVDEIRRLVNEFNVRSINILDDVFIADKKRFYAIAEAVLNEGLNRFVSFHGFVRANLADEDIVKTLKSMNFNSIRFGAETGSNRILRYLKKGTVTVEQNQNLIDLCNKYGLDVGCSFVFGTPGETENDLKQTVNFLEQNAGKMTIMGFYLLQAVPGAELWLWAIQRQLVSEEMDWSRLGLDFQKEEFSWEHVTYLNNEFLPFERFRKIIDDIKNRFLCENKWNVRHLKDKLNTFLVRLTGIYKDKNIFVEVGSGGSPKQGYIHCDIYPGPHVEYVCNAWEIPFDAESIDEIYARHVLEHLTYKESIKTLSHWLLLLKTGGRIDINVPDIEKHIEQLKTDGNSPYVNFPITQWEHGMAGLYGWQSNERDIHKWGYTIKSLSSLLKRTGFVNIKRIADKSLSGPLNLRLIAEKPTYISRPILRKNSRWLNWKYYNWQGLIGRILRKLKIAGTLKYVSNCIADIFGILKKDYSSKGDRQVSANIDFIRKDHVGRYRFACRFINEGDKVLDCACGVGYGSFIISQTTDASLIVGVDRAPEAIEFACRHYYNPRIEYIASDIFKLNISYDVFDVVVSLETIEHLDGPSILSLFNSKLKQNGLLIVSTPNQDTQPFNSRQYPTHMKHYSPEEFDAILSSAGFEIIGKYTQYFREKEDIVLGWNGLFNIAVARKIR